MRTTGGARGRRSRISHLGIYRVESGWCVNSALMFSKATDEWATPQAFYDALNQEFGFGIDAASTVANAKVDVCFAIDHPNPLCRDALTPDWDEVARCNGVPPVVWLNPPYSRCREFIEKARKESLKGCTVVCLVPSRTDTKWWHEWVYYGDGMYWPGVEVRFVKGRLKFGNSTNSAPFPSVVIVFRPVRAGRNT